MIIKKGYIMGETVTMGSFEWDSEKNALNAIKHGVRFEEACRAFGDPGGVFLADQKHSQVEERWLYFGKIEHRVLTIRFTYRESRIRIYGAGFWRIGGKVYEKKQN